MTTFQILHYTASDGHDLFVNWMVKLRDRIARVAIDRRVNRMCLGNFGDHNFCRDGVWELRIDVGAGYRVYYAIAGNNVVKLHCCGDKRTQQAYIERACDCWQDWQRRINDESKKP